jgi:hypothetical protein
MSNFNRSLCGDYVIVPSSPSVGEEEIEDIDDDNEEVPPALPPLAGPSAKGHKRTYSYTNVRAELRASKRANAELRAENAALRESVRLNRALLKQEMLKWAHMCGSIKEWIEELDLD